MAPPPKVTSAEIVQTLERWRGNLSQTARDLGITRKALKERLKRLRVGVSWGFDQPLGPGGQGPATIHLGLRVGMDTNHKPGSDTESGHYANGDLAPILPNVVDTNSAAVVAHQLQRPPKIAQIKLPPDILEMIQDGRLRLQGVTRFETSNDNMVRQCLLELYQEWVARKIEEHRPMVAEGGSK